MKLIQSFEEKNESGIILYLDDNETRQLIEYYEQSSMIDKALTVVDMALEVNMFREEHYLLKAKLLRKDGRYNEALEVLEESALFAPNSVENTILKIALLLDLKSTYLAEEILYEHKEAIKLYSLTRYYLLQGRICEVNKDYERMYPYLKKALIHNPESKEALEKFWIAVELTNNYHDSIKLHKEIISYNPYNFLTWYNLGHAYQCVGEYSLAVMAMEYSFIIEPTFEAGYVDCADICIQTENIEKALTVYLEALRMFGPESELLSNIGVCYLKLGESKKAGTYLRKAIKLDPYNDEVYFNLANCFVHNEEFEKSVKYFLKAISLEDRREEYYAGIAQSFVTLKNYSYADYYFRKATETGPEDNVLWEKHISFLLEIEAYDEALGVIHESELYTYSDVLVCQHVITLLRSEKSADAYHLLMEVLKEDVGIVDTLFSMDKALQDDLDIKNIIRLMQ